MPRTYCPQLYDGSKMLVTSCNRCSNWNKEKSLCEVYMGIEHLPIVAAAEIPDCPLADHCQHQIQAGDQPCTVRARGFVCESVVGEEHPLAFNAVIFVQPDDDDLQPEEYPCP